MAKKNPYEKMVAAVVWMMTGCLAILVLIGIFGIVYALTKAPWLMWLYAA